MYSSALDVVRSTMWNFVGIVRSQVRLNRAKSLIDVISEQTLSDYSHYTMDPFLIELRNTTLIAQLIINSALKRKHSIGLHYNIDFPDNNTEAQSIILRKKPA